MKTVTERTGKWVQSSYHKALVGGEFSDKGCRIADVQNARPDDAFMGSADIACNDRSATDAYAAVRLSCKRGGDYTLFARQPGGLGKWLLVGFSADTVLKLSGNAL